MSEACKAQGNNSTNANAQPTNDPFWDYILGDYYGGYGK